MNREKFEKVWGSSESVKEVCKKLKISQQSAYYWARKFDLPTFCGTVDVMSPTPEEIAERAAEVRAGWSKHEEQRRAVGSCSHRRYSIPSYTSSKSSSSKYPVFTKAAV